MKPAARDAFSLCVAARRHRRSRRAGRARPLRSGTRQGFLRRRLHRRHQGPQVAPDRRGRARRSSAISSIAARSAPIRAPATAPASWCRSRTRFFAEGRRQARLQAARAGRLRRRPAVHAARPGLAADHSRHLCADDQARGPDAARLARRADRQLDARRKREADRAGAPAGVHRPRQEGQERGRVRAPALHPAQGRSRTRSMRAASAGSSDYYPVSLSCRTIVYKGMFLADQLGTYYPDLHDPDFESALALVHQRFSTNTFPTWSLAHPYRMVAHNGEINTLRGNVNWMAARQASVSSRAVRRRHLQALADLLRRPVRHRLLRQRARIPGAGRLLARARDDDADPGGLGGQSAHGRGAARLLRISRRADGAVGRPGRDRLHRRPPDRRDARPQRPAPGALLVTRDDRIIMASEMGVLPIPEKDIVTKWRLQPGKMLLVDLDEGRIISDEEIKATLAKSHPYATGSKRTQIVLEDLPAAAAQGRISNLSLLDRQQAFGYTQEDLKLLMTPMAMTGRGSGRLDGHRHADLGAVGQVEAALHLLQAELRAGDEPADRSDPRRARHEPRLVHRAAAEPVRPRRHLARKRLEVRQPILTNEDLEKIRSICDVDDDHFKSTTHRHHLSGRARRRRHATARSTGCARAPKRRCTTATTSSSCPTAASAPSASRSRRCSPAPPCIII